MTGFSAGSLRARFLQPQNKRDLNREIFTIVAPRYDTLTRVLSFGRDFAWKAGLVASLPERPAGVCLDLACGTGDIALLLAARYPSARIIGLDLTEAMLERARARCDAAGPVRFLHGDMARTGLAPDSVDIVTGGYALRNAGDLDEILAETVRVLKPGGVAAFLDFSKPANRFLQRLEFWVLKIWGGFWGVWFHRDPGVYAYIAESLRTFPDRRQLEGMLRAHGLEVLSAELLCCGMVQRMTLGKAKGA